MNQSATAKLVNESPTPQTRFLRGWTAQLLWIVPAILVFAPTTYWLWQRWTMSVWHNVHGLFIPFVAALFIRKTLRSDPIKDADQSAWGFLFLILGLGMVALDSAIRTQLLSAFGLVVCLPGFSLLLLGKRRTKALAFVWILCFFMLPIPAAFVERLIVVLRNLTAVGAEYCLTLLGMPMLREGTLLVLPRANLEIADACSGFATLYASFTLALILAVLTPSWPRRLLLLAAAFPIAVACNILRATLLALAVQRWGVGILSTTFHPASGVVMFTLAAVLLAFLSGLRKEEPAA
jgi:exosortase